MTDDDLFDWAASLPHEHECVWVEHPTPEERQARTQKVVMRAHGGAPVIKVRRIETWVGANVAYAHFKECAICDKRINTPSPASRGSMPSFVSPDYRGQILSAYKDHDRDTAMRQSVGYGNIFPHRSAAALQHLEQGIALQRRDIEALEARLRPNGGYADHSLADACIFE